MIDKTLASVVTMSVVFALSIIVIVTIFASMTAESTLARQQYEQEYSDLLIKSVLQSHDNETGMTYEKLLIEAIKQLSPNITVGGEEIDVEERFAYVFDELVGEDNYLLSIKPATLGVSVSYILDGTQTMTEPRTTVETLLPTLISDLKDENLFGENASLFFHIYILTDDNSYCDYYRNELPAEYRGFVECQTISGETFYDELIMMQFDPAFQPPYPEPFESYTSWLASDHFAKAYFFSDADWSSGVAYASLNYARDFHEMASTNGHVIITVADELTTGSKADECYTLPDSTDTAICILCDDACPEPRAQRIINQTKDVIAMNGDRFVGFYVFPDPPDKLCDYSYNNDVMYTLRISEYVCRYVPDHDDCPWEDCVPSMPPPPDRYCLADPLRLGCECFGIVAPPANSNWCRSNTCGGCTEEPINSENYCYHQDCNGAIIDDLQDLADISGGNVFQLAQQDQLLSVISDYYENRISTFNFTLGEVEPDRNRFVVEEDVLLAQGKTIEIQLWLYD